MAAASTLRLGSGALLALRQRVNEPPPHGEADADVARGSGPSHHNLRPDVSIRRVDEIGEIEATSDHRVDDGRRRDGRVHGVRDDAQWAARARLAGAAAAVGEAAAEGLTA